jgi:hypothetical protein
MSKTQDKTDYSSWLTHSQTFDNRDNHEITDFKDVDNEPNPRNEWGHYGEYVLVGNGKQTSERCGCFRKLKVCLHVERHNHCDLNGVNYDGKIFWKKQFHSCDKPECPVCFKRGWAVREAKAIEYRLKQSSDGYTDKEGHKHVGIGLAEHIVFSVPQCDYGLKFESLKAKALKILMSRGIIGGVIIFHAFRYRSFAEAFGQRENMGWYWSPHFHCLGFIEGGYGKCRSCSNFAGNGHIYDNAKCMACSGFEGRTRRLFNKEAARKNGVGYIVKVLDKRKTVVGTAWYQLNHSSFVYGSKRAKVTTWFGVCSYRKMKIVKKRVVHEDVCPICQSPLEEGRFVGDNSGNPLLRWWELEGYSNYLDERGVSRWVLSDLNSGSHKNGSWED